ncbi:hypothetical protein GCM10027020_38740 [Nocardioides salsibiostraticola]
MTPRQIRRCLVAPAASLGLLLSLAAAPGVQAASSDTIDGDAAARQTNARAVLAEAEDLFSGNADSDDASGRDASMVLRDLQIVREDLSPADQAAARKLETRPNKPLQSCNEFICVHYDPSQVNPTDANTNEVPDYIDFALATVTHVHDTYIAAGYRSPLPDGTNGGDARIDIYIDNIGPDVYGYCTTDTAGIPKGKTSDTWAYCVLDNDYSKAEFKTNTPLENLQVTAAHEYFHATQYAYDFYEDRWLLESTATWMEDEMYDGVDDNINYLPGSSALTVPKAPLDSYGDSQFQYGNWIFWRFLTERHTTAQAGLPTLVRDVFTKVDDAAGGPDKYSLQALKGVLRSRGRTLPRTLAEFAAANRAPKTNYEEGRANKYPTAKPAKKFKLSNRKTRTGPVSIRLDHLSSATTRFIPKNTRNKARIKLTIDMDETNRGSAAIVSTKLKSGKIKTNMVKLNKQGNGRYATKFGKAKVKYVELTLVNASDRFNCFEDTEYSCAGDPKDDNVEEKFSAVLKR